jgi:hypothetical protein
MTPEQLYKDAIEARAQGAHCGMTLVFGRRAKKPRGFPKGELLCETENGLVFSFDPDKVIKWLEKYKLVKMEQAI